MGIEMGQSGTDLAAKAQRLSEDFLRACQSKDYAKMQEALDAGADIDYQNVRGVSQLMAACLAVNLDMRMIGWLLDRGASPAVKNLVGDTALHEAAKREDPALLRLLAQKCASVDVSNNLGSTPLMEACAARRIEAVKILLSSGCNPNLKTEQGTSALLNATMRHDAEIVELLLKAGADANDKDSYGVTALISACQMFSRQDKDAETKSMQVVKLLLKAGADPNERAKSGNTPLAEAANCLNRKAELLLLDHGANPNVYSVSGVRGQLTPLMVACLRHDVELALRILEAKADPNFTNDKGDTAIKLLFNTNIADKKDRQNAITLTRNLLARGAKLDKSDGHGLAHYGVLMDSEELLEEAQKQGVLNQRDKEGHTALHVALFTCKEKMALKLLDLGADPNVADNEGNAPLHIHASKPVPQGIMVVIKGYLAAKEEEKRKEGEKLKKELDEAWIKMAGRLLDAGAQINAANKRGASALMASIVARANGASDDALINLLLERGADVSVRDEHSDNALVLAIKTGDLELSKKLAEALEKAGCQGDVASSIMDVCWTAPEHPQAVEAMRPVFQALIERGASANYQDEDGQTPLIVASATNQEELASLLLDLGADPNLKNNEGEVPAAQAIANNHLNITSILFARGADPDAVNNEGEDLTALAYRHARGAVINQIAQAKQDKRQKEDAGVGFAKKPF